MTIPVTGFCVSGWCVMTLARRTALSVEPVPSKTVGQVRLFDVIQEKSLYGRKFMGIERSTFLFDGRGSLAREWRKVRVKGHAAEVLEAAKSL